MPLTAYQSIGITRLQIARSHNVDPDDALDRRSRRQIPDDPWRHRLIGIARQWIYFERSLSNIAPTTFNANTIILLNLFPVQ